MTRADAPALEAARLELGVAALSAARRNRPRWLVWFAALLVIAAIIYTLVGLSALASARARLGRADSRHATLTRLVQDINALRAAEAARGLARDARIVPKLENWAAQVQLQLSGAIQESDGTPTPGMARKRYTVRFNNQDPGVVLTWLNMVRVSPDLAGLELIELGFNMSSGGHTGQVIFERWEKNQ